MLEISTFWSLTFYIVFAILTGVFYVKIFREEANSNGDDFFLVLVIGFLTGFLWWIALPGYLVKKITD